jgi:ribosomal protein L37AE/L43A
MNYEAGLASLFATHAREDDWKPREDWFWCESCGLRTYHDKLANGLWRCMCGHVHARGNNERKQEHPDSNRKATQAG